MEQQQLLWCKQIASMSTDAHISAVKTGKDNMHNSVHLCHLIMMKYNEQRGWEIVSMCWQHSVRVSSKTMLSKWILHSRLLECIPLTIIKRFSTSLHPTMYKKASKYKHLKVTAYFGTEIKIKKLYLGIAEYFSDQSQ